MTGIITRFAPSPTGLLHLGHAYSAIYSYNFAKKRDGAFLLRIENIDPVRCKTEYIEAMYEDLAWLGLSWEMPVRIQSDHMDDYKQAITKLEEKGILYPCFCTRKDIREEVARAGYAPHGPEGMVYPGTCRQISAPLQQEKMATGEEYALRLNLHRALELIDPDRLFWWDQGQERIQATPDILGDIVIARKDIGTSYHLSVVIDDALQGVTHITRGEDLQYATHIQRVLQEVLDLPQPEYRHHGLIQNAKGRRLAKRDKSITLKSLRENGVTPEEIYQQVGLKPTIP